MSEYKSKLYCVNCDHRFEYITDSDHLLAHVEKDCSVRDIKDFNDKIRCPKCNHQRIRYNNKKLQK